MFRFYRFSSVILFPSIPLSLSSFLFINVNVILCWVACSTYHYTYSLFIPFSCHSHGCLTRDVCVSKYPVIVYSFEYYHFLLIRSASFALLVWLRKRERDSHAEIEYINQLKVLILMRWFEAKALGRFWHLSEYFFTVMLSRSKALFRSLFLSFSLYVSLSRTFSLALSLYLRSLNTHAKNRNAHDIYTVACGVNNKPQWDYIQYHFINTQHHHIIWQKYKTATAQNHHCETQQWHIKSM